MPARSGQAVHHRTLVWVLALIDVEWILVVYPALRAEMVPRGRRRRAVHFLAVLHFVRECDAIIEAEKRQEARDLDDRKHIALSAGRIGGRTGLCGGRAYGTAREECDEAGA